MKTKQYKFICGCVYNDTTKTFIKICGIKHKSSKSIFLEVKE